MLRAEGNGARLRRRPAAARFARRKRKMSSRVLIWSVCCDWLSAQSRSD